MPLNTGRRVDLIHHRAAPIGSDLHRESMVFPPNQRASVLAPASEGIRLKRWKELVSDRPSMTVGETPLKARGCPPICFANRFPPRPLRGAQANLRGPDSRPADHRRGCALESESDSGEDRSMTFMTMAEAAATGQITAHIFQDFESIDLHWAARREERYLGLYDSLDEDDGELARVAILGCIAGKWFAATCLVDGEGAVQDLIGRRDFGDFEDADRTYRALR